MTDSKSIKRALISVFYKDGLESIVKELHKQGVIIYSTGGTETFITNLGISVEKVENLTSFPSIFGGRVKTLHPKIFGGILSRGNNANDLVEMEQYEIPRFDLVIVDLYPFEETLASGASEADIIEKIDIGGISLIRAAAKNFSDVCILSSRTQYADFLNLIQSQNNTITLEQRKAFAAAAFQVSSHYDSAIYNWFSEGQGALKISVSQNMPLRYGENPHQKGSFYGDLDSILEKLHGKELSYNNLLDVDAAMNLISEFDECTFAILKHNNACGVASRSKVIDAWKAALEADPKSAFGGVLICNKEIDLETAHEIDGIFYEVLIAPSFSEEALLLLSQKKNRILMRIKSFNFAQQQVRTVLNGILVQERDGKSEKLNELELCTFEKPNNQELEDLLFANKIAKHTKSNTIVLAKNKQLIGSGTGQTSRVDALEHAIAKAKAYELSTQGAVMASDAFFPFPDCVEIAHLAGIRSVIQPGGSINDKLSINYCNEQKMAMVLTGTRHFKH
jgi:phosphoribosylaminoimidazolecarboxamide formyltransferase / IMP cyclohydrolase